MKRYAYSCNVNKLNESEPVMNYYDHLNKVIDFIGQHLDEEISLDRLSDLSGISKHCIVNGCLILVKHQAIFLVCFVITISKVYWSGSAIAACAQ